MAKWRVFGIFCFLASPFFVLGQNPEYTGVWQGKFYDNSSFIINNDPYKFEVQFEQNGKALEGVTYSYLNTSFYGKAAHNGYVKTDGKKLVFVETRLLELRSQSGLACLMTCNMRYYKQGGEEYLEGTYTAVDKDNGTPCPGGYVKLKKVQRSDFRMEPNVKKRLDDIKKLADAKIKPKPRPKPKPIPPPVIKPPVVKKDTPQTPIVKINPPPVKKDTPVNVVVVPPVIKKDTPVYVPPVVVPPVLKERSNELVQQVIMSDTNEVVVNLYDYGEVDGDIVTIFLDNREIISKQMLRVVPISIPIKVNEQTPEHTLTLVAENLGSIPPNTALMVVYVDGERYEVKIESTEQKNATVKFVFQPKPKGKK